MKLSTPILSTFLVALFLGIGNQSVPSTIEGIVKYKAHAGGTREAFYPSGFILTDYQWIVSAPRKNPSVLYLIGAVDSSLIDRRVRIEGEYTIPTKIVGGAPDYSSKLHFNVVKVQLLD